MRNAPPGHCTNCHAPFEPDGRDLCPPCRRAFVMGIASVDDGASYKSYREGMRRGIEIGAEDENERLRNLFLNREEHGLFTFAEVVDVVWPEGE